MKTKTVKDVDVRGNRYNVNEECFDFDLIRIL